MHKSCHENLFKSTNGGEGQKEVTAISEEEKSISKNPRLLRTTSSLETVSALTEVNIPLPLYVDVFDEFKKLPRGLVKNIKKNVRKTIQSMRLSEKRRTTLSDLPLEFRKKDQIRPILIGFRQHKFASVTTKPFHCSTCCTKEKRKYSKQHRFSPLQHRLSPPSELGSPHHTVDFFPEEVMIDGYDERTKCGEAIYAWLPSSSKIAKRVLKLLYCSANNVNLNTERNCCDHCGTLKPWFYEELVSCLAKMANGGALHLNGEEENFLVNCLGKRNELYGDKKSKSLLDCTINKRSKESKFFFREDYSSIAWGFSEVDAEYLEFIKLKYQRENPELIDEKIEERSEETVNLEDGVGYGQWFLTKQRDPTSEGRILAEPNSYWEISTESPRLYSFQLPHQCCKCQCAGTTTMQEFLAKKQIRKNQKKEKKKRETLARKKRKRDEKSGKNALKNLSDYDSCDCDLCTAHSDDDHSDSNENHKMKKVRRTNEIVSNVPGEKEEEKVGIIETIAKKTTLAAGIVETPGTVNYDGKISLLSGEKKEELNEEGGEETIETEVGVVYNILGNNETSSTQSIKPQRHQWRSRRGQRQKAHRK